MHVSERVGRGRRGAVLFGLATVTLAAGCMQSAETSDSTVPAEALSGTSLLESGVGVVAEGCSLAAQIGTGVVLGEVGQVVTVAHTIKGAKLITVIDYTGTEHAATVLAFDSDRDLAVLDVAGLDVAALDLGAVRLGDGVALTWGRDEGVELLPVAVTRRLLVTIEDIYLQETVRRDALEVEADIQKGDSGGPIVSSDGDVIGIIYANSRQRGGIGFAIETSEIASVLRSRSDTPVDNGSCFAP